MRYIYNDGGRAAAGYKGYAGDCAVRSIAIATGLDYKFVYDAIKAIAKREHKSTYYVRKKYADGVVVSILKERKSNYASGVYDKTFHKFMKKLGWKFVKNNKLSNLMLFHEDDLPTGNIIVELSGHYVAVIDGVANDSWNTPAKREGELIDGYWYKPKPEIIYIEHYADVSYFPEQINQILAK